MYEVLKQSTKWFRLKTDQDTLKTHVNMKILYFKTTEGMGLLWQYTCSKLEEIVHKNRVLTGTIMICWIFFIYVYNPSEIMPRYFAVFACGTTS